MKNTRRRSRGLMSNMRKRMQADKVGKRRVGRYLHTYIIHFMLSRGSAPAPVHYDDVVAAAITIN